MSRRPFHDPSALIRDPADWATDTGWISRRRACNFRARLDELAERIIGGVGGDSDVVVDWAIELRKIGRQIAPDQTPSEKRIAAMREP
jgi:hypothetical protein